MKPKKQQPGFTLIEMLVAMALVAILATVVIANYREANKRKSVQFAADSVINALREAQNNAVTGLQIQTSCVQGKAAVSFAANFIAGTNFYTITALDKCANTITLKNQTIPKGTLIKSTGLLLNGGGVASLNIKFTPPFGNTEASTGGAAASYVSSTITLESADGTITKTVTVDGISSRIQ